MADSMEEASALANKVGILAKQMLGLSTKVLSQFRSHITYFQLSELSNPSPLAMRPTKYTSRAAHGKT